MFDLLVTCYLFLGGVGAGALVFLSLLEFLRLKSGVHTSSGEWFWHSEYPSDFYARTWPLCFGVLAFAILCLLLDFGRLDRVFSLVFSPAPTALTVGTFSLIVSLICAGFFLVIRLFDSIGAPKIIRGIFSVLGVVTGFATALYTGILLSGMASILFWQSPFLPLLFLLSSLSTGLACLFLGAIFADTRESFVRPLRILAKADSVIIIFELICLLAYLLFSYFNPATEITVWELVLGELSWIFWVGLIGCGLVVPLILEQYVSAENFRNQLLWIALFVLVGGAVLRFCIVETASFDITQANILASEPAFTLSSTPWQE